MRDHKAIRCVLVHELVLLRQGVRRVLEDEPGIEVVAEAGNTAEALRAVYEHRPEVVIADANVFGCASGQAEQLILEESPTSTVVFLPCSSEAEAWPSASENSKHALRQTSADELVK